MVDSECELAVLRADFNVPLTYEEFCQDKSLEMHTDKANLAYRDYYGAFRDDET